MNKFLYVIAAALLTAACKKDPPPPIEFKGQKLESLTYSDPAISVGTDGTVKFDYTATATFTLTLQQGGKTSTKDTTINNIKATATAKAGSVVNRVILEEGETLGNPIYVVTTKKPTPTSYEETAELRFNGGKLVIPFTLKSDSISVTIRRTKVPLTFGHGKVAFTAKDLGTAESIKEGDQKYQKQALTIKTTFTHTQKNASKPLPDIAFELLPSRYSCHSTSLSILLPPKNCLPQL